MNVVRKRSWTCLSPKSRSQVRTQPRSNPTQPQLLQIPKTNLPRRNRLLVDIRSRCPKIQIDIGVGLMWAVQKKRERRSGVETRVPRYRHLKMIPPLQGTVPPPLKICSSWILTLGWCGRSWLDGLGKSATWGLRCLVQFNNEDWLDAQFMPKTFLTRCWSYGFDHWNVDQCWGGHGGKS